MKKKVVLFRILFFLLPIFMGIAIASFPSLDAALKSKSGLANAYMIGLLSFTSLMLLACPFAELLPKKNKHFDAACFAGGLGIFIMGILFFAY